MSVRVYGKRRSLSHGAILTTTEPIILPESSRYVEKMTGGGGRLSAPESCFAKFLCFLLRKFVIYFCVLMYEKGAAKADRPSWIIPPCNK